MASAEFSAGMRTNPLDEEGDLAEPCALIGDRLRRSFDDLSDAPLPNRIADLAAALEAACRRGGGARGR